MTQVDPRRRPRGRARGPRSPRVRPTTTPPWPSTRRRCGAPVLDRADRPPHRGVRRRVAQRLVQLLLVRAQVLPRGLPGHAGDPERVVDADRLPRERHRHGARRAGDRRRRRRLRELHPVRRLRAALPQHAVHRRLLPLPHPDGRRGQGRAGAGRGVRRPPAAVADLERAHRRADPRAGAGRGRDQPGAGPGLGRRAGSPDRRRDGAVRRLRGRVLPHLGAAGGGADPARRPASSSG